MIFDICYILFIYAFYIFVIRKTFSSNHKIYEWSYMDCNIFINDYDIICTDFSEDLNETNICHDWSIYNQSIIIYLPEECSNKTYTIEKPMNNFNNSIQKSFNITITNNFIIPKNYKSNSDKYFNVNNCLKFFNKVLKECSLEDNFEKCLDVKQKLNITDFCINTILEIIEVFQDKVESLINQSEERETNLFQEVSMIIPKEKKDSENFQNLEPLNDKKSNIFSDHESKKDCVEYGLKSNSEEILVCLKYE
jgi:hypothetical protein